MRSPARALFDTLPGRLVLAGAIVKLALGGLQAFVALPAPLVVLNSAASLALALGGGYFLVWIVLKLKRRLLWRVRRKLILSYIFIGFVPALLIVAFFLLAGLLMFINVSSYLLRDGLDDLMDEAQTIAQTAAIEIRRGPDPAGAADVVERAQMTAGVRHPGLSLAVVPAGADAGRAAGPWAHIEPPAAVPEWIGRAGFAGILAYLPADAEGAPHLLIRAVAFPDGPPAGYAVVVDLPLDARVAARLRDSTGIRITSVDLVQTGGAQIRPLPGRARPAAFAPPAEREPDTRSLLRGGVLFIDYHDWESGRTGRASIGMNVRIADLYQRVSDSQARLSRNVNLGDAFLVVLVVIAGLFLIIEFVALVMGFALARSITGSVHSLFTGTARVRQGDFSHRIRIGTRDQLGELAESFNQMTGSIEDLLQQAAEKKRMEEELRIAREIQMSLLPRGVLGMPGLAVTALCVPAREVGGDYYDFFPLGDRRLGVLIADVSGKGTSAALYMAELKGLMLSLSQRHASPKPLLIELNRLLTGHLDSRSFITMTYAVLDLEAGTLTYARAGHTPLIHLPAGDGTAAPAAAVLQPDGLVLGLRIEGIHEKFVELLEERTVSIAPGDVFALFTDGVTEAMDAAGDLFGESRLAALIAAHGHLPAEELRERILRDVEAFVGGADQHDDLTLILLKIEGTGAPSGRQAAAHAAI